MEDFDLGTYDRKKKKLIFVSTVLPKEYKEKLINLVKEYKDYFGWNYDEMSGLSRELIQHRLPLKKGYKHVKLPNRRLAPRVVLKIKQEIERVLKVRFIRTTRYAYWVSNLVSIVRKWYTTCVRIFQKFKHCHSKG